MLLTRLKESALRWRYTEQACRDGWSRTTLELQIRYRLHERQGQGITNFETRLSAPHSDLAHETLKDPYLFDFLRLGLEAHEREERDSLLRSGRHRICHRRAA
jgi:predicted nuclease of restriction endonuclease-like (RecB) superfamily